MKKKILKISSLFMVMLMATATLAACGGSAKLQNADIAPVEAEPNAGIRGIVYTIPEGWGQVNVDLGKWSELGNDDTDFTISVYVTTEDELQNIEGEDKDLSIKEYYDKHFAPSATKVDKETAENFFILPICDGEGTYAKSKGEDGNYYSASASWFSEDAIYSANLGRMSNYDENGLTEDAVPASDADFAAFEAFLGSVRIGDGTALQTDKLDIDTFGSLRFELPEGYEIQQAGDNFMEIKKAEGDVMIKLYVVTEDTLDNITMGNGEVPKSIKEAYESSVYEGMEPTKIAGYDGVIDMFEDDDGKIYTGNAELLTDDGAYTISIDAAEDMWDSNGERRTDIEPLSDEDLAAFRSFLASMTKK